MSSLPVQLSDIAAGFAAPALSSQEVFRGALEALSRPGRIVRIGAELQTPPGLNRAAAALALALLDQDTRLWLAPSHGGAGPYFRFHAGCILVQEPAEADFALLAARELPPLGTFAPGSDEYPDRSAMLFIEVEGLAAGDGWTLSGPGMRAPTRLRVDGLGPQFLPQWAENHHSFPRGIDAYLACGDLLCGLPRTTRIEA